VRSQFVNGFASVTPAVELHPLELWNYSAKVLEAPARGRLCTYLLRSDKGPHEVGGNASPEETVVSFVVCKFCASGCKKCASDQPNWTKHHDRSGAECPAQSKLREQDGILQQRRCWESNHRCRESAEVLTLRLNFVTVQT